MTGTELPICVSVPSDLLFEEEYLRLLPGQPSGAVSPTHKGLWGFPAEAQTYASVFPGPVISTEFPAAGSWKALK